MDPPDTIRKKFKLRGHRLRPRGAARGEDKPGITNLIEIMSVAAGETPEAVEAQFDDGGGYGQFKEAVGEAVVALLAPVQERYRELRADEPRAAPAARDRSREGAGGLRRRRWRRCTSAWDFRSLTRRGTSRPHHRQRARAVRGRRRVALRRRLADRGLRRLRLRARRARLADRGRHRSRGRPVRPGRDRRCSSRRSATCPSSSSCCSRCRRARSSSPRRRSSARCSRTPCSSSASRSSPAPARPTAT